MFIDEINILFPPFQRYHQWNSKPEFVVATHRVLPISDVIKLLKKERDQQLNNSTDQDEENGEKTNNETNSVPLSRKSDKKQKVIVVFSE